MKVTRSLVLFLYSIPVVAMEGGGQLINMKQEIQATPTIALENNKNYLEYEIEHNKVAETKAEQKLRLTLIKEELSERQKKKIDSKNDSKKFEQSKME